MIIKELFKSWKFIMLISMAINVVLIVIGTVWFDNNYIHLELSALLPLSLLMGPFSILGFTVVEVIYWVLFFDMTNPLSILYNGSALLILGIFPWKLWYYVTYEKRYAIPNMNSFYSFIKIIIIIWIMILQTYLFTYQIFYWAINLKLDSYYMIFVLGLVVLLLGMGIFGRYNIPTYIPGNIKKVMPEKLYDLSLILSIILSIITINSPNDICIFFILILSTIFLIRPLGEEVHEIENSQKLTIFYKAFFSIFIIMIIIPTLILALLKMSGYYASGIAYEFLNYMTMMSWFFLAILIPLVIYMLFLERQVIKPIEQLSTYLSEEIFDENDLKTLVNNLNQINVNNEIKSLAESMIKLERELMDYTKNLLDVTIDKERYETELKLAHEIQYSMIPTDFEKFNENNNFSIWGYMNAAHDVGGDFYDYFMIDEDNLGFAVGDVSGKGVTAALIMVKAMTLIADYTTFYPDLSDAVHAVNNELCKDNVEELFVTCWIGKLNTKTGELSYVNAGHDQPLIRQDDGNFEYMNDKPGLVLAGMEDVHYKKHTLQLKPNDMLFLYTDGVTEANDSYKEFYGKEKLQNTLNQNKDHDLSTILKSVENDVREFCNNREQFDDTTMFIIKID